MRSALRLTCILVLAFVGCGPRGVTLVSDAGPPPATPDTGGSLDAGRRDAGRDAGPPDAGPVGLVAERWGARIYAPAVAITRQNRTLWLGTRSVEDPSTGLVRGGLVRLNLDTGAVRVFENELPVEPDPYGMSGPVATAGAAVDGTRLLVVARSGLLELEGDVVTSHPLSYEGVVAAPTHLVLDRPGPDVRPGQFAKLWVATDLGLLVLDPSDLSLIRRYGPDELGGSSVGALAADPDTGAIFAAVYDDDARTSRVVRILGDAVQALVPGADGVPSGRVGEVVFSRALGAAIVALMSHDAASGGVVRWNGTAWSSIATEGQLAQSARGRPGPFGAWTLAVDDVDEVLIVGGRIRGTGQLGPLIGGGLAWIDLRAARMGEALRIVGASTATSELPGSDVTALVYDPQSHRTYAALREPCNEIRIGNVGLVSISFVDGTLRVGTPVLSGVRDVAMRRGRVHLALRDDIPGLRCDGVGTQTGVVVLGADHGGPFADMHATGSTSGYSDHEAWRTARIGATRIAVRDDDHTIVAGRREELFFGGDQGLVMSLALEAGLSNAPFAVAWQDAYTFWVAGPATHHSGDIPILADVGPRGAAKIAYNSEGRLSYVRHFVGTRRDPGPEIVGLPSNEVTDVLLAPDGVYLVCGTERVRDAPFDRAIGGPFPESGPPRRGGVARIVGERIDLVASPDEVPDGRAAALDAQGRLLVLDAERGLLRREGTMWVQVRDEPAIANVPAGSEPHALYVHGDVFYAGYSSGAYLRIGDEHAAFTDAGHAWRVMERADGVVLVGTDEGLLRVRRHDAVDPGEGVDVPSDRPPFSELRPPPPMR